MTRHAVATAALAVAAAAAPETWTLDIAEKRIFRERFRAATALETGPESGIHVRAGAAVSARAIDLVLRNVRGTVTFHADSSRLRRERAPEPVPSLAPAPDQH